MLTLASCVEVYLFVFLASTPYEWLLGFTVLPEWLYFFFLFCFWSVTGYPKSWWCIRHRQFVTRIDIQDENLKVLKQINQRLKRWWWSWEKRALLHPGAWCAARDGPLEGVRNGGGYEQHTKQRQLWTTGRRSRASTTSCLLRFLLIVGTTTTSILVAFLRIERAQDQEWSRERGGERKREIERGKERHRKGGELADTYC